MENASYSSSGSCASALRLQIASSTASAEKPEHCVKLTKEQYDGLCELQTDPLFKKAIIVPSSYPSWEKLINKKKSHPMKSFTWIIYHYWLGSLKFALQSKKLDDGDILYGEIFSIYEDMLSKFESDSSALYPPRKRQLIFSHIGEGMFQLKLAVYDTSEVKPQGGLGGSRTTEECRRRVRVLALEAMHTARGSPWPKACRNLYDHVAGLPVSLLETDGVEFSHKNLDQATIGPESAAYRHELRRSVAYIAEQMELRGDNVDWYELYVGAITTEQEAPHNLLSSLSESMERFIKRRGNELLHKK